MISSHDTHDTHSQCVRKSQVNWIFSRFFTHFYWYAYYSWYTITGVERGSRNLTGVLFTHDTQYLCMINLLRWHHMHTDTPLFTHDTRDLRKEEYDLRMIRMIASFMYVTWFMHSTHVIHKSSFTHETSDLCMIYAIENLFTHDTRALLVFLFYVQTGNYLRVILRVYAWFTHDTWTA